MTRFSTLLLTTALFGCFIGCGNPDAMDPTDLGTGGAMMAAGGAGGSAMGTGGAPSGTGGVSGIGGVSGTGGAVAGTGGATVGTGGHPGTGGAPAAGGAGGQTVTTYPACQAVQTVTQCTRLMPGTATYGYKDGADCSVCVFVSSECRIVAPGENDVICVKNCTECDTWR